MKVRTLAIVAAVLGIVVLFPIIQARKRNTHRTRSDSPASHGEARTLAPTVETKPVLPSSPIQRRAGNRPQPAPPVESQPVAHSSANTNKVDQAKLAGPRKLLHDPLARQALALVGQDPDAEAYWYGAINNPDLPPEERKDLIEDLNEDGLADPKHPTNADLPLILSRIQLIELLGPSAMDNVNGDAFQEAYKDLLNLVDLALGGGEPVN